MARGGRVLVGLAARWQKFRQEKRTSIKVFCFACICLLLGLLWNHKNLLFAPTETDDNYGMITISKGSVGGDTPRIITVRTRQLEYFLFQVQAWDFCWNWNNKALIFQNIPSLSTAREFDTAGRPPRGGWNVPQRHHVMRRKFFRTTTRAFG